MGAHALQTPHSGGRLLGVSSPEALVARGCAIIEAEANALRQLSGQLDQSFAQAVRWLLNCQGSVVVSGMGKAGLIGQKLSASLSSTGTPSHFLHPAEAVHGDIGCVRSNDVVVLLSYSGETDEISRILPILTNHASAVIAITARSTSTLGRAATIVLPLGEHAEAGVHGIAPSTTTTAMLALGDALTLVVSEQRGFTREQFARNHPAGNLGRQLTGVCEVMRPLEECRVAFAHQNLREVLVHVRRPGRRTGAIMLTDQLGKLVGIFTDSDLARLLERAEEVKLDEPIDQVMTRAFTTVNATCMLPEAMQIMAERKISELPVVNDLQIPLGMMDVTDVFTVGAVELTEKPVQAIRPTDERKSYLRVVRE